MRFDSCRQCMRRRINCDAGEPECQKCKKKGISCSGVGRQYRFVDCRVADAEHGNVVQKAPVTSGHQQRTFTTPSFASERHVIVTDHSSSSPLDSNNNHGSQIIIADADVEVEVISHTILNAEHGSGHDSEAQHSSTSPNYYLPPLDSKTLMLFDYFSSIIAPAMVAIDDEWNGYRNIILPLATKDPLIQRAVIVVGQLHLARRRTDILEPAVRGRAAIIKNLHRNASLGRSDKIYNISTWATILLLLVGETVTGDQGFIHLFPMLNSLLEGLDEHSILDFEVKDFLRQQTQMFKLFTPPFIDPSTGVAALQQQLNQYLEFLSHPTDNREISMALETIRESIYLARDLYIKETKNETDADDRWLIVEQIKQLVYPIGEDTLGMHALVWTYFIAGAASSDHVHRGFFLERLHQVYNKTGMGNVLAAINLLQTSVWSLPKDQNWSTSHAILNQVLIM